MRKYSVVEIDQMRRDLHRLYIEREPCEREEYLRTYMLNGTEPEEIKKAVDEKIERKRLRS